MTTISIYAAARLAEATVKLWDFQGNAHQGLFFRLTPQAFATWKTDHGIGRTLGTDIEQSAAGLLIYTRAWEEKLPPSNRCNLKIQDAVIDAGKPRNYPKGIRKKWYNYVKRRDPPVVGADQEWIEVLNEVVKRRKEAVDFMIKKHTAGVRMINAKTTYQEASIDAVTLPGDMYTEAITYPDAMATARELTGQGTR